MHDRERVLGSAKAYANRAWELGCRTSVTMQEIFDLKNLDRRKTCYVSGIEMQVLNAEKSIAPYATWFPMYDPAGTDSCGNQNQDDGSSGEKIPCSLKRVTVNTYWARNRHRNGRILFG